MSFIDICYLFIFYSFLGWISETTIVSIQKKHLINMGLLDGPFSPIYGFGALIIIFVVFPFRDNIFYFFTAAVLVASTLEYATSYFFEKIFEVSWWNYCHEPFNLNGRICLETSLYWGVLSIFVLYIVQPIILPFINFLSSHFGYYGIIAFAIYFIIDATNTFHAIFKYKKFLSRNIKFDATLNKKITRLLNSFPNLKIRI